MELPKWADPRLQVTLKKDRGNPNPPVYVIDGNHHIQRGRFAVFNVEEQFARSVRFTEIEPDNPFANAWIKGYLAGSEPDPLPDHLYPEQRLRREVDFYHKTGRVLPPSRCGMFSIFIASYGAEDSTPSAAYATIAGVLATLRRSCTLPQQWTSILPGNVDLDLGLHRLDSPDDIRQQFEMVNPPYSTAESGDGWPSIRCISSPESAPNEDGSIEVYAEFTNERGRVREIHISINTESVASLFQQPPTRATDLQRAAVDILRSIANTTAEFASVCLDPAKVDCDDMLVQSEDLFLTVTPGWANYVSARSESQIHANTPTAATAETVKGGGTIITSTTPITDLSDIDVEAMFT